MGDAYRLDEFRFIQEFSQTSGVAATSMIMSTFVVPANTIRTLLFCSYGVDVGEARYIVLKVVNALGVTHSIRGPLSHDSNNGNPYSFLEQGQEVRLAPGDYLRIDRSAATAGSAMTLYVRYIDSIMPFQEFKDPYDVRRKRSPYLPSRGGGGGGTSGGSGPIGGALPGRPGGRETPPMV